MKMRGRRTRTAGLIAGIATLALTAAACGDSGSDTGNEAQSPAPSEDTSAPAESDQETSTTLVTWESSKPFEDTVGALKEAVSSNGMMVLGDLNQAGALQSTGLDLPGAHTFFVGNPTAGKTFFEKTAAIGSVIPLRMYVWADSEGTAKVSYFDPKPLFEAVDPGLAEGGQKMSMASQKIANAAAE
ncbi:uncharacterized protein (DUF302 family) [Amycolatopsis cihanbeyliensis]|uniref:Uncharacterized protein (DUF302 family) n=2 Tax=Amycolatopsis cihanbeyliensis TaxID=1128664 RepID=A0A542DF84_AMYCI|nr:uncharacterized protein (DUF302 family) [Amycolatopsis cihanbeyliensis]